MEQFKTWLFEKLTEFALDDDVFVDYILGILEEESMSKEEQIMSIDSFLACSAV
eukprot:Awhi_evm1s10778